MGEPLNFVAGGERLFKNYLRELLMILCIRGERHRVGGRCGRWWITHSNGDVGIGAHREIT